MLRFLTLLSEILFLVFLVADGSTKATMRTKAAERDRPAVYWINTNVSISRGQFMTKYLRSLNLTNSRVEGFSTGNLPHILLPSWYTPQKRKHHTKEMACLISHMHAIRRGYEESQTNFVVAEDDFTFFQVPNMTRLWESAPTDAMILLVGFTTERGLTARWEKFKRTRQPWTRWTAKDPVWGTLMYSISTEGARNLLNKIPCGDNLCNLSHLLPPRLNADFVLYSAVETYVFGFPFVKHLGVGGQQWKSLIHGEHSRVHRNAMSAVERIRKELWSTDARTQEYVTQFFGQWVYFASGANASTRTKHLICECSGYQVWHK